MKLSCAHSNSSRATRLVRPPNRANHMAGVRWAQDQAPPLAGPQRRSVRRSAISPPAAHAGLVLLGVPPSRTMTEGRSKWPRSEYMASAPVTLSMTLLSAIHPESPWSRNQMPIQCGENACGQRHAEKAALTRSLPVRNRRVRQGRTPEREGTREGGEACLEDGGPVVGEVVDANGGVGEQPQHDDGREGGGDAVRAVELEAEEQHQDGAADADDHVVVDVVGGHLEAAHRRHHCGLAAAPGSSSSRALALVAPLPVWGVGAAPTRSSALGTPESPL